MDKFDDRGIMALVCRHDIPLFFANIDTPGEQQKYGVALLEHLFSLIPRACRTFMDITGMLFLLLGTTLANILAHLGTTP